MNPKTPSFEATTKLVARSLGLPAEALLQSCRLASPADLEAVLALRREVLGALISWDDEAYLRWRYFAHPTTPARLWMLEIEGRLIAVIGAQQVRVSSDAGALDGHVMMDLLADPAFEGSGIGVWLNQFVFTMASFTLAVGANQNSIGLVRRLFAPLPSRESLILPVAMAVFLARHGVPRALSRLIGPLANAAWSIGRRFTRPGKSRNLTLQPITVFDDAILVTLNGGSDGDRIEIIRDAMQLNWRLFGNPRARFIVTGAFRDGLLLGYIASRHVDRADGSSSTYIIDCPAIAAERDGVVTLLLDGVIGAASTRRDVSVNTVMLDGDCTRILRRNGFLRRGGANHLVAGVQTTEPVLLAATASGRWCISDLCFDSDGEF